MCTPERRRRQDDHDAHDTTTTRQTVRHTQGHREDQQRELHGRRGEENKEPRETIIHNKKRRLFFGTNAPTLPETTFSIFLLKTKPENDRRRVALLSTPPPQLNKKSSPLPPATTFQNSCRAGERGKNKEQTTARKKTRNLRRRKEEEKEERGRKGLYLKSVIFQLRMARFILFVPFFSDFLCSILSIKCPPPLLPPIIPPYFPVPQFSHSS